MPGNPSNLDLSLQNGVDRLATLGLNLFACFSYEVLTPELRASLKECYPEASHQTQIILLGHGGKQLWNQVRKQLDSSSDPIDLYSRKSLGEFCDQLVGPGEYRILYPGDQNPPLQQLGRIAGWHSPSPLGIGINGEWGLWYAYRAMAVIEHQLPTIRKSQQASPCDSCTETFCASACPAGAVKRQSGLDLKRCADFRLLEDSPCADRCLARIACPVQGKHRYSHEQIRYHYLHSLETLRAFYAKKG